MKIKQVDFFNLTKFYFPPDFSRKRIKSAMLNETSIENQIDSSSQRTEVNIGNLLAPSSIARVRHDPLILVGKDPARLFAWCNKYNEIEIVDLETQQAHATFQGAECYKKESKLSFFQFEITIHVRVSI